MREGGKRPLHHDSRRLGSARWRMLKKRTPPLKWQSEHLRGSIQHGSVHAHARHDTSAQCERASRDGVADYRHGVRRVCLRDDEKRAGVCGVCARDTAAPESVAWRRLHVYASARGLHLTALCAAHEGRCILLDRCNHRHLRQRRHAPLAEGSRRSTWRSRLLRPSALVSMIMIAVRARLPHPHGKACDGRNVVEVRL